jgi:nitrate reductase NapE
MRHSRLAEVPMEASSETSSKHQERTVFLILTVALFPVLAVAIVVSYGLAVWIWQMLSGLPGS